jgi:hypothetical protein
MKIILRSLREISTMLRWKFFNFLRDKLKILKSLLLKVVKIIAHAGLIWIKKRVPDINTVWISMVSFQAQSEYLGVMDAVMVSGLDYRLSHSARIIIRFHNEAWQGGQVRSTLSAFAFLRIQWPGTAVRVPAISGHTPK